MVHQTLLNRITVNPKVMVGKPTIRGLRITVEQILKALANGISRRELLEDYPELENEDIQAALYNEGFYHLAIDYQQPPEPQLLDEDGEWAKQLLAKG